MDIKIASYEQNLIQKNFWIDEMLEHLKALSDTKHRNVWMYSGDDLICLRYKCGANSGITGSIILDFRGEYPLMSIGRFWDNQFTVYPLPYKIGNEWLKPFLFELIAEAKPLGNVSSIGFDDNYMGQWFTKCDHYVDMKYKPSWIVGDFEIYEIREGFLMIFPDDSIRLIDKKEYREFDTQWVDKNIGRQGDVICFQTCGQNIEDEDEDIYSWSIGRHDVSFTGNGMKLVNNKLVIEKGSLGLITIDHPEHERVWYRLDGKQDEVMIVPIPGTSRPFQSVDDSGD